jgi:hypothetical protein
VARWFSWTYAAGGLVGDRLGVAVRHPHIHTHLNQPMPQHLTKLNVYHEACGDEETDRDEQTARQPQTAQTERQADARALALLTHVH